MTDAPTGEQREQGPPGEDGAGAKEANLRRQMDRELDTLRHEFADLSADRVTALGEAQFDRLRAGARITEFIPVLVHRYAREELIRIRNDELRSAA
jgi:hypothetical protein